MGKVIAAFRLDGSFIRTYPSISLASSSLHISRSVIHKALKGDLSRVKSYMFRYVISEDIPIHISPYKDKKNNRKAVIQYDLNNKYIRTYKSINEALKCLGKPLNNMGIHKCLDGTYQSAFNYHWKYKDLDNVRLKRKPKIYMYKDKKLLKTYQSVKEASLDNNISVSSINNAIRGFTSSAGGYVWKRK